MVVYDASPEKNVDSVYGEMQKIRRLYTEVS